MIAIIESSLPWVNLSIFFYNKIETEKSSIDRLTLSHLISYTFCGVCLLFRMTENWMQMRTNCASSSSSVCLWTHGLTPLKMVDYYAIRLVSYRFTSTIKSGLRFCLMMMLLLLYWEMSGASIPNMEACCWLVFFFCMGFKTVDAIKLLHILTSWFVVFCSLLFTFIHLITHIRTVCYNLI